MTPLRAKMIKAMRVRGFSVRTHESYLAAVTYLARYVHRSPDKIGIEDIRGYFEYLATERSLSGASCRLFLHGIRFLYLQVLERPSFDVEIPIPKKAQRIPELLTRAEVGRILTACANPKHRMMLTLCYGCGLRLSELVSRKVRDIDGERQLLRVEQGKGAKDRLVPLSETLLAELRAYWRSVSPHRVAVSGPHVRRGAERDQCAEGLHPGQGAGWGGEDRRHSRVASRLCPHQLEAGLPVHRLQRLLGHQDIHSTLRYVHWVPDHREGRGVHDLIAALGVSHD